MSSDKPLITLITATGGRPEAFAKCEQYIKRQTYQGPIQWIIIDDCEPATPCTIQLGDYRRTWIRQEHHEGPKRWRKGINTQRLNLDKAIEHVRGEYVFVIEDDDYYREDYIEAFMKLLQHYSAVGEGNAKYYNIAKRMYKEWNNYLHASLCQTAFKAEYLPIFDEAVNSGVLFMDCEFWRRLFQHNTKPLMIAHQNYVIGMKGLPGRFGIGAGHQPEEQGFKRDPDFRILKSWVGDDWLWYKDQVEEMTLANINQK